MTDTGSVGQRVDQAIAGAKQAVADLQAELQPKLQELGQQAQQLLTDVGAKIDEVQAAVAERLSGTAGTQ